VSERSDPPIRSINALAETTIGLFKAEAVGRGSPFVTGPLRTVDDVEYATMEWVDWFNDRRLHGVLGYVAPGEYETAYYAAALASRPAERTACALRQSKPDR
jgi:putative transposase